MTALPLAMTTVWLANTASLLLPVSNLTNLLAADRVGLKALPFARQMALPQLAAASAGTGRASPGIYSHVRLRLMVDNAASSDA